MSRQKLRRAAIPPVQEVWSCWCYGGGGEWSDSC
ncbi:hypothetical protein V6Z11_D04G086800 [Gossypium hirsutum]